MSNTPRTDAATLTEPYLVRELPFEVVRADDMEKLETELAAFSKGYVDSAQHNDITKKLAAVTAERDALKAKLATINHIAMSLFVRNTSCEVTGEMAEIGRLSREDGQ